MTIDEIIKNAIPDATDELCERIILTRVPYPMGAMTAKSLWKAAYRHKRATEKGLRLCDLCDGIVAPGKSVCEKCDRALRGA